MFKVTKRYNELWVTLKAVNMGKDLNVCIYGGDTPHIGAVALSIIDETNTPDVSVMTIKGHREDIIARDSAIKLSQALGCNVCVSCGIHKNNASFEEINIFCNLAEQAVETLKVRMKK